MAQGLASAHLALAHQLWDISRRLAGETAEQVELRAAVSRAYYAVFHICNAWLLARGSIKRSCGSPRALETAIGRTLGEPSKRRLQELHRLRGRADYVVEADLGDLRFREWATGALATIRAEFDEYLSMVERLNNRTE